MTEKKNDHRYKITTLCYIERDDHYLMLYRNKKENDMNEGKWVGIGGKLEDGESPDECMLREVYEETGLKLQEYVFHGVVTFISDTYENEYMMLYTGKKFQGELVKDCPEGELRWIPKDDLLSLPMWEGDPYFLKELLSGKDRISMKLVYEGEMLKEIVNEPGIVQMQKIEVGALIRNLSDQLKEAQIKLGFAAETTRFYYPLQSLNTLLGADFVSAKEAEDRLNSDPQLHSSELGRIKIKALSARVEVTLSPAAAEYVHTLPEPAFLRTLINAFSENHHMKRTEIIKLFETFGDSLVQEVDPEAGFDFAVMFEDNSEDPYVYCFKEEMGHMIYHRFTHSDFKSLIDNK